MANRLKSLNATISTPVIFTAASITLLLYLLGLRFHAYLPVPLFLISIGIIISVIIYQIGFLKLEGRFVNVVLFEITVANLLFHLIYQIPGYGLWGSDAYSDFASMKSILESGFIMGIPEYVQITSYFPILHVIGTQVTLVTNVDSLEVAKYLPSILDMVIVPLFYLFVVQLFKNKKAALLGALLFICLQHRSTFGSFFIRETIGVILAFGFVYLYTAAKSTQHVIVYRILAIVMLACTVLAHHLTSMMIIIFLIIHFIITNTGILKRVKNKVFPNDIHGETVSFTILILATVITFTYWVTTVIVPLRALASFVSDLLTPATWGKGTYVDLTGLGFILPTFRYYVLVYGSYFCYLTFGLLLLGRLKPKAGSRHLEMYSFTAYLIVCGILGIISFFLIPATVIGNRFLTFGWLFAFGPLVVAITEYRHKWLVRFSIVIVVFFLFSNMFTIHPTEWNPNESGSGATASFQDFILADTIDFSHGRILANLNNITAIYYKQNVQNGTNIYTITRNISIYNYDWIIINRTGLDEEGLYSKATFDVISELRKLYEEGSPSYYIAYESDNLLVLKSIIASDLANLAK